MHKLEVRQPIFIRTIASLIDIIIILNDSKSYASCIDTGSFKH